MGDYGSARCVRGLGTQPTMPLSRVRVGEDSASRYLFVLVTLLGHTHPDGVGPTRLDKIKNLRIEDQVMRCRVRESSGGVSHCRLGL